MTKREQIASASRDNADNLSIGLPVILMWVANTYFGVEMPELVAIAIGGVIGNWGGKIKRHI